MSSEHIPAATTPEKKNQISYVQRLAGRYWNEMRLLLRGGRLKKNDEWRNVAEHCVVQLAAAEVLADLLSLPTEDRQKLCSVAAVHDWRKRIDVSNRKASKLESPAKENLQAEAQKLESEAQPFLDAVKPDQELLRATGEEFLARALVAKEATFLEKLQFYLDDICGERADETGKKVTDLIPLRERIAEVAGRRQDLNDDPRLTATLGGKYWDRELELGLAVEQEIFRRLQRKRVAIEKPEDVPAVLRAEVLRRMHSFEKPMQYDVRCVLEDRRGDPEKNEDQILVQEDQTFIRVGVFDGATAIADLDHFRTLGKSPGRVASEIAKTTLERLPLGTNPKTALLHINEHLRMDAEKLPLTQEQKDELFSVVGLVATLDKKTHTLHFATAGDCHLVTIDAEGKPMWHTINVAAPFERIELAAGAWAASHAGDAAPLPPDDELLKNLDEYLARRSDERSSLRGTIQDPRVEARIAQNRRLENDPKGKGYPSLKGSPPERLLPSIQTGEIQLARCEKVFLFTDGLLPGPLDTAQQRQCVEEALRNNGIQGLLQAVRSMQEQDPELRDPPRFKQFDDAAGAEIVAKQFDGSSEASS